MSRIVFALELGHGLNYLSVGGRIAHELAAQGHEITFLTHQFATVAAINFPFTCLPAPFYTATQQSKTPENYAEILLTAGYQDEFLLRKLVEAWRGLFCLLDADLLIAHFAPTAQIAALTLGLPFRVIGSGFTIPPDCDELPAFLRPNGIANPDKSVEPAVLQRINQIFKSYDQPALNKISDLFPAQHSFILSPSGLDHYPSRAGGQYCSLPTQHKAALPTLAWPSNSLKKILVYLKPSINGLSSILTALIQRNDCTIICIIPGISQKHVNAWSRPNCQIQTHPIALSALLANADLVVNDGGHGLVAETLAAGVPILLAPEFIEQYMLAQRVLQLGVGLALGAVRSNNIVGQHLTQLLNDEGYKVRAKHFSVNHHSEPFDIALILAK